MFSKLIATLNAVDLWVFAALNGGVEANRPAWLDYLMLAVSSRGTWIGIAIVVVIFALWRRRLGLLKLCLLVGLALGLSDFVTFNFLKPTFARERPCHQLEGVRLVQSGCGGDYGFPSNHAANSMATVAAILSVTRRRTAYWLFGLAGLVGLSRIYLGVHFLGDVLAGFVVGALMGWVVAKAYQVLAKRLQFKLL